MPKPIAFSIIGLFLGFYFSMVLLPKGNLIFRLAKNVSYFWAIRVIGTVFGDSPSYPAPMATFSVSADTVHTIKMWQGTDGNDNDNNLCASCRRPIYKQNINQQENTAVELSYFFSSRVLFSFQVSRDEFESFTHISHTGRLQIMPQSSPVDNFNGLRRIFLLRFIDYIKIPFLLLIHAKYDISFYP